MPLVRVTGTNLMRDTTTMALINTDEASRNDYHEKLRMIKMQKNEINTIKTEMIGIKNDITELKNLMLKLLDKG